MKRFGLSIILTFLLLSLSAQSNERWHEDILTIKYGYAWLTDEYLSILPYDGQQIGLQNEWWQKYNKHENWGHIGKLALNGAMTYNNMYSNILYGIGAQAGWGSLWRYEIKGFELRVGPYLNVDFMSKIIGQYVNKPYSLDLGIDADLMLGLSYRFAGKKTSYRLSYWAQLNGLGVAFAVDHWESYYELQDGISKENIGFAYIGKKVFFRQSLTFDMQFKHSTWRLGVEHEYFNYEHNNLGYQREEVSMVVGTIFNYRLRPATNLMNW